MAKNLNTDYMNQRQSSEGLSAVQSVVNSKWGFINDDGVLIIPCTYDDVSDFSYGVSIVQWKKNIKRYGLIDSNGKRLLKKEYSAIRKITPQIIALEYSPQDESLANLKVMSSLSVLKHKDNRHSEWHYYSLSGKILFGVFDEYKKEEDGRIKLIKKDERYCQYSQYCYVDASGIRVTKMLYETKLLTFFCGRAIVSSLSKPKKYGYVNEQGEVVIPIQYDFVKNYHEEKAIVALSKLWGVIDTLGNTVFQFKYDSIWLCDNTILGKINGARYLLIEDSEIQVPYNVTTIVSDKYIICSASDGKYGVVDIEFKEIIPFIYDMIDPNPNGFELFLNKKCAVVNSDNIIIRDWDNDKEEYQCERYRLPKDYFEQLRWEEQNEIELQKYKEEQILNYNGFAPALYEDSCFTSEEIESGLADAFEDDYDAYLSSQ